MLYNYNGGGGVLVTERLRSPAWTPDKESCAYYEIALFSGFLASSLTVTFSHTSANPV